MLKIAGGSIKGLHLSSPQGDQTRPTGERMRQALFNVLQHKGFLVSRLESGAWDSRGPVFADLYCGTGAVGIEAASRGATQVFFVEQHPTALSCLRENLARAKSALSKQNIECVFSVAPQDVVGAYGYLPLCDVIFADPPYGLGLAQKVIAQEAAHNRLRSGGVLVIEESAEWSQDQNVAALLGQAGLKTLERKNYGDSSLYFFVKTASESF